MTVHEKMFKYENLSDEEFFGCKYRAANPVINSVFGDKFQQLIDSKTGKDKEDFKKIVDMASERGSAVHTGIEHYLNSNMESPLDIPLEYAPYQYQFEQWMKERTKIIDIYGVELKIINDYYHSKGIIDFIGKFKDYSDGREYIAMVDWKTSSSLDLFRTQCQLTLYYLMLIDLDPYWKTAITELRCLQINKTNYRWFKFPIDYRLGENIFYIYNQYFREEAEKRLEKN